jgi:hypothetical protein
MSIQRRDELRMKELMAKIELEKLNNELYKGVYTDTVINEMTPYQSREEYDTDIAYQSLKLNDALKSIMLPKDLSSFSASIDPEDVQLLNHNMYEFLKLSKNVRQSSKYLSPEEAQIFLDELRNKLNEDPYLLESDTKMLKSIGKKVSDIDRELLANRIDFDVLAKILSELPSKGEVEEEDIERAIDASIIKGTSSSNEIIELKKRIFDLISTENIAEKLNEWSNVGVPPTIDEVINLIIASAVADSSKITAPPPYESIRHELKEKIDKIANEGDVKLDEQGADEIYKELIKRKKGDERAVLDMFQDPQLNRELFNNISLLVARNEMYRLANLNWNDFDKEYAEYLIENQIKAPVDFIMTEDGKIRRVATKELFEHSPIGDEADSRKTAIKTLIKHKFRDVADKLDKEITKVKINDNAPDYPFYKRGKAKSIHLIKGNKRLTDFGASSNIGIPQYANEIDKNLFREKAKEGYGINGKKRGVKKHTQKFGSFVINKRDLENGILGYRGGGINKVKKQVPRKVSEIILDLSDGVAINQNRTNELNDSEIAILDEFLRKSNSDVRGLITLNKVNNQIDDDFKRYELIKGEIMSGNDNPDMLKEFKKLILKLKSKGLIDRHDADELLTLLIVV